MEVVIAAFACAVATLWGGRCAAKSPAIRFKLFWAGMCFLLIGVGAAYLQLLEKRSPDEVAEFVPPYPRAKVRTRPPMVVEGTRGWIFETTDKPRDVARYYAALARTNGWFLKRKATDAMEVITIEQIDIATTILIVDESNKTEITYLVRELPTN